MNDPFEIVGVRPELLERQAPEKENRWYQGVPWLSVIVLLIIAGGCLFCKWIMPKDPSYMDLKNYTVAPCREFLFGTDTMGRDIFSMIWYGGRQSLFIGFVATMISTSIAIIFGTVSGLAPEWLDMLLMRTPSLQCSMIPGENPMLPIVTHENDRDFAEHSQSASSYFSTGDSGEGKCAESVVGYRSYKLDQYSESSKNRSTSAKKQ